MVAFSPEREDPGNETVARKDIPKVIGGLNTGLSNGWCILQLHLQSSGTGFKPGSGGNDQTAGKYLPLCEYRSCKRVKAALYPNGN